MKTFKDGELVEFTDGQDEEKIGLIVRRSFEHEDAYEIKIGILAYGSMPHEKLYIVHESRIFKFTRFH